MLPATSVATARRSYSASVSPVVSHAQVKGAAVSVQTALQVAAAGGGALDAHGGDARAGVGRGGG